MADLDKPQNGASKPESDLDPRREGQEPSVHPDLTTLEVRRGKHQGDKYVRVIRSSALRKVAPGILRASEAVSRPSGKIGRWYTQFKAFLVGKPLPSEAEKGERLNKIRALAVLSSDAISSSAYATEEILLVVILAGTIGLFYSVPIAIGIAALLAIVAFSYRQTVYAYPQGGGAYNVARENLGTPFGLIAAAALLVGYIMTVAVSVAAGTAAITSAFQELYPYNVEISIGFVVLITMINLRGVKESGTIFAVPTYLFIFGLAIVIILGVIRILLGDPPIEPQLEKSVHNYPLESLSIFLLLRGFAAGTVAMTGTEAIANGVPVFQPPESKNAATTLAWMSFILAFFFVGLTAVAFHYGVTPHETETVISQVARIVLQNEIAYGFFQVTTMLILILAANTSFFGFPRLAYVLAQDGFMPHQLKFRGDRLVFTTGIVMLGAISILLLIAFGGSTHALIPLYAVGVFISFTLSQSGMVRHWWKTREPGWRKSMVINALGALLTALVVAVVGIAKFALGAWIVIVVIPILVFLFYQIHRHYARVAEQLTLGNGAALAPLRQIVIVPVGELNKASLRALNFARSISKEPLAVRIFYEPTEVEEFRKEWAQWGNGIQVVFLESPYRSFNEPLLAYIDAIHRQDAEAFVTIVLPEFIPAHWWEHFLHNQTALRLKTSLLFRKNTVVIDVPYHLAK